MAQLLNARLKTRKTEERAGWRPGFLAEISTFVSPTGGLRSERGDFCLEVEKAESGSVEKEI